MVITQIQANPCSQALDTAILLIDPKDELTPEVARMLDAAGQSERLVRS